MSRFNAAKEISIITYLNTIGIHPATNKRRVMIKAFWRDDKDASVAIDTHTNRWWDFGSGESGTIIDLVSLIEGITTIDAVNKLLGNNYIHSSFSASKSIKAHKEKTIEIVNVLSIKHPALKQYLTERMIPSVIYNDYLKEVHYRCNEKKYFTIGFRNDIGGWMFRNKLLKNCTSQHFTYYNNGNKELCVFEGVFDFLSFLTMQGSRNVANDYLILNSTVNITKASDILKLYAVNHCYLDNDSTGFNALQEITNINQNTIDHSDGYKPYNDYNEWHIKTNGGNMIW